MFNAFIDPAATAKAVPAPLFWLWPLLIVCAASIWFSMFVSPLSIEIMRQNQAGLPADQVERALRGMEMFGKILPFVVPITIVGFTALLAALVMLTASMLSLKIRFRDIFALMCACGLINVLQIVASYFVLRAKAGELASMQQLQPPFGLDIFFSELKGPLYAILNYFSLFQVWYLIMLGLALAYFTRAPKGKAFAAITPAWLLPLIFKVIGSIFQRG